MTVDVTYVELKNFPKYVCQIDIFGVPCLLTASYNSRKGQRLISLTSYDSEIVYLKPTFITNFGRVFLNFNMLLNELNVYVTLEALTVNGVKQTSTDYLNWSSSYRLAFVSLPPVERLEGFRNLNDEKVFLEYTWIVDSITSQLNGDYQSARYFSNRIIDDENYNSFADLDLVAPLVKSFLDSNLQQWQAVKDAIGELTGGATEWTFDNAAKVVKYSIGDPLYQYRPENSNIYYDTGEVACDVVIQNLRDAPDTVAILSTDYSHPYCRATYSYKHPNLSYDPTNSINTWINKETRTTPLTTLSITYQQVADKIIANSSVVDQGISLLAEAYLEAVANSVYNTDESKQFVSLKDLKPQFELNKVLVQQ